MSYDKLSICNSALIRTGNTPVAVEGDGSDEWMSASDAYDTMLPVMLQHHDWGFASTITTLNRSGASTHPDYTDAYYKPNGCFHVQIVWLNDTPCPYRIMDNQVLVNANNGVVTAKYIRTPGADQWPDTFVETLRLFVMAALYRGLNEDNGEADKLYDRAMKHMALASSRMSQEDSPRYRVNSRLLAARKIRRLGWTR